MLDLCLSVACSSLIFIIFKLFSTHKVETLFAIIINYIIACSVGLLVFGQSVPLTTLPGKPWFFPAVGLGILFIVVFNLMARTSQDLGVSVASVATKMSLAIPVLIGVWLYNETLSMLKIVGIILALLAVYYASVKPGSNFRSKGLRLPALVFLGSGIIDVSIKYIQDGLVAEAEFPIFSSAVFAAAALTGFVFISTTQSKRLFTFGKRNILAGIILGVPNFFSIYFLLRALNTPALNSATVFTLNNVAIVMCTTLLGIALFKEHISKTNWGGIGLAVISILLVALF
ncbi:MAG: DMT family transporter [Bacteroidia bacterium]|nr:DMT family transporter [Bacteroidia bacterium]